MKYFKTKHEKNSAKLTALIAVILLLLLFVVGTTYMDPPEEYGVAVNFGNSSFGKGNIQPLKPVKSEPRKIEEPPQPDVSKAEPEPAKSSEVKEEVLTQENAEEIAIKKQKQAEAKAKAIADAKAKAEADRIAKEKREQEEKRKKLDALIGGVSKSEGSETGSEGNDNTAGDKGSLDGNPYAPSYFGDQGTGSGGVGYGLNGRGKASFKRLKQDCNESGMVIVKIIVNQNGNVVSADPGQKGTTNTAQCLLEPAKKIAMSHKWPSDSKAPSRQIGFVSVNFKLSQ
ncbi:energy transducer TonB [uncultured Algibacter sp.]|uniref:energy transducer TonB n=1 Tax=uncultured Algibacter sp. TaxID=298659 RepID=UPI00260C636E|nr:energy transducer TonB [uncultured Algibacter sp.]